MTVQLAIRLPDALLARIDPLVGTTHESRSDVVRRALEHYLYRLECERDAAIYAEQPLGDAELVLAADPNAWKGTPEW